MYLFNAYFSWISLKVEIKSHKQIEEQFITGARF